MLLLSVILSLASGKDFYGRVRRITVATRPSWLPATPLLAVLRRPWLYLALCHGVPVVFLFGAMFAGSVPVRFLVAAFFSAYVLAETSHTHSHRDIPNMYVAWSLALIPARLSRGFALGVCVHFIASSGFSKVLIGGVIGWAAPGTMRSVLRSYGALSLANLGPGWPALNRWSVRHDTVLVGMSVSTLIFECVAVPASLFLGVELRVWLAFASVALHLGIASAQSLIIGFAFIPNVASYVYGFGAPDCEPFDSSGGWPVAVAVVAASSACVILRGKLLPEDWPSSPFALFPWSGPQWDLLFDRLSRGRTRLVLASVECQNPLGCAVLAKDSGEADFKKSARSVADTARIVHDSWEQVVGETLVMSELLPAFDFEAMAKPDWKESAWPKRVASAVQAWLERDRRLIVVSTGKPLLRAYFVELHATKDVVVRVISR